MITSQNLFESTDIVYTNARIATMNPTLPNEYGLLLDHDIIVRGHKILAIMPTKITNKQDKNKRGCKVIDVENCLITPGFIDCHTHLVFGGNRASEWEMRLNGMP